jgi:hypothetical protein
MRRALLAAAIVSTGGWALALGPIDGEAGVVYWDSETDVSLLSGTTTDDTSGAGLHAEVWLLERWGFRGAAYDSEGDSGQSTGGLRYINAELNYKFFKPTENTFLAAGLGWKRVEFGDADGGSTTDVGGVRASIHGRFGFAGFIYVYGQAGWTPSMSDVRGSDDFESQDAEVGISFEPAPFLSVRAGYRMEKLDFTVIETGDASVESDGFFVGAGVHW